MEILLLPPSLKSDRGQAGGPEQRTAVYRSLFTACVFPTPACFLFPHQAFCIPAFIVDSVLSLSLSDMTPGSFVCSGRLTGVDFCAAILHLF